MEYPAAPSVFFNDNRNKEPHLKNFIVFMGLGVCLAAAPAAEERISLAGFPGKIALFRMHEGAPYFSNAQDGNVRRYGLDGAFAAAIGRKGQGPQEVEQLLQFHFLGDRVYLVSPGSVAFFDRDGKFLEKRRIPFSGDVVFLKNGNCLRIDSGFSAEPDGVPGIASQVVFLDRDFREIRVLVREKAKVTPGFQFEAVSPKVQVGYAEKSGRVFVSNPFRGALISIYDEEGRPLGEINDPAVRPQRIPDSYKEKFVEALVQTAPGGDRGMAQELLKRLHWADVFPAMAGFSVDDPDGLWVKTYAERSGRRVFRKYSLRGDFLGEAELPDDGIDTADDQNFTAFDGGSYFYVYVGKDGEYGLYRQPAAARR